MKRKEVAQVPFTYQYLIIFFASAVVYVSVITGPFLHDDNPALLNNPDVQGNSELSEVFSNDFWGKPMKQKSSHKSYRPLTILFFRCIHSIWGNWSTVYHVTNILCHSIASLLFFTLCRRIDFGQENSLDSLVAGLLFSLHPIHTEAVCGIVGCAELLSAICFLSAILIYSDNFKETETNNKRISSTSSPSYELLATFTGKESSATMKSSKKEGVSEVRRRKPLSPDIPSFISQNSSTDGVKRNFAPERQTDILNQIKDSISLSLLMPLVLAALAMLCKESGVTVLGVILINEILSIKLVNIHQATYFRKNRYARAFIRISVICLWSVLILSLRMKVMGWRRPVFDRTDNPTHHENEFLTRLLTYTSLFWINFGLLIYPINLCYDYSYTTIPLITSLWDHSNLISVIFLIFCSLAVTEIVRSLKNKSKTSTTFVLGCSIMVCSFLPASNIFFPVGFVVAERVLYMPSAGFVIILVLVWRKAQLRYLFMQNLLRLLMTVLILSYSYQTIHRSFDWTSKERFLKSGVKVAPQNAKIRYNWANYLRANNQALDAAKEYKYVLKLHPSYVGAMNNLGTILEENQSTMAKAEEMYVRAIQVQPLHENAYINLAKLLLKQKKYEQATKVLVRAIKSLPCYLTHVTTLASLLVSRDRLNEAEHIYMHMLNQTCLLQTSSVISSKCSQDYLPALSAYADLLTKRGEVKKSLKIYNSALRMNSSNSDILAGFSRALAATGRIEEASKMMLNAVEIDNDKVMDLWRLASAYFQKHLFAESKSLYKVVASKIPDNKEVIGQYAAVLFQSGEQKLGEEILLNITRSDSYCKENGAWDNLATLYGQRKRHKEAINLIQMCFTRQENVNKTENFRKRRSALLCQLAKHEWDYSKQLVDNRQNKNAKLLRQNAFQHLMKALKYDATNTQAKTLIKNMKNVEKKNEQL